MARPMLCVGTPDHSLEWLVTVASAARGVASRSAFSRFQLHVIGFSRRAARDSVMWPSAYRVAFVLGHAAIVIAPPGPLAFDAIRFRIPVLQPATCEPYPDALLDERLPGLVPASLLDCESLWRHVAAQTRRVAQGQRPEPLCTPEWLLHGRALVASAQPRHFDRTRRRIRKLWREPARFFAESRHSFLRKLAQRNTIPLWLDIE
jgi:hypothetical protein